MYTVEIQHVTNTGRVRRGTLRFSSYDKAIRYCEKQAQSYGPVEYFIDGATAKDGHGTAHTYRVV